MSAPGSLAHRLRPAAGEPEGALMLFHGRGADEHDLHPLLDILDPERRLLGATPRGPLALPPGGAQWYAVREVGYPDPETFLASYARVSAWLGALAAEAGVPFERVVLGLLAGRGDELRPRARARPPAPGRDRRPQRLRPGGRGLRARPRLPAAAARDRSRGLRPDHRRRLGAEGEGAPRPGGGRGHLPRVAASARRRPRLPERPRPWLRRAVAGVRGEVAR